MAPQLIAMGASLIPQIAGLITAGKQRPESRRANAQAQAYFGQSLGQANQSLGLAKQGFAKANNDYNARMAGAANIERDIKQNQANTMGSVNKNATDASQVLAIAGALQGNSNNAYNQLAQLEAQNKLYQQQNVNAARQGVMGAQQNLQDIYGHQSDVAAQSAAQLGQAAQQNQFNAFKGLSNGLTMAGMGQFGDLGEMFGGSAAGGSMPGFTPGMLDPKIQQLHNMYRIPITNAGRIG